MKELQLIVGVLVSGFLMTLGALADDDASASRADLGKLFKPDPLEPAPASLVLDKARLFNEREASQLSARLQEFRSQNDVSVYVVAYSILIGESIEERAARLKDEWLSDKGGIVVVYQRGTERITFSSTADPLNYVGRHVLEELFGSAYAQASQQVRGSSRVIAATDRLMADLPAAILTQRESNEAAVSETRGFVGWSLAGLVFLTIAGMVGFHFLRGAQARQTETYEFPSVRVEQRFGAPYCGGHQAEMAFTIPSP